ncbi:MAG: PorT family protein [Crocinitomicaceae bacterium]|nr:PorT family protein [Crocinitomicaceae bacterium]
MSWTDEELDQLFSDAASNATVEYNDAYWKDIEGMLPVRKKRKGLLWWMGGAGALVFFGTLLLVQVPFTTKSTVAKEPVRELASGSTTDMSVNSSASSQVKKSVNSTESYTSLIDTKLNSADKQSAIQNTIRNKVSEGTVNPEQAIQQKVRSNESTVESLAILNNSTQLVVRQDLFSSAVVVESNSNVIQQEKLETEGIPTLATIDINPFYHSGELIPSFYKLKTRSPHALYAEVGLGLGQSPIISSENGSAIAKNYGLQLGYSFQKSKFRYSAGLGISVQQFDNVYIKERSLIYGFGSNSVDNHYRFSSLMRVEVPLAIGYQFKRHTLSAGASFSFPVIAGLSFTKYVDGNMAVEEKGYTSTEFFKPFGAELQVGYTYQLGSNWELGAKVQMQLINPIASDRILGISNALPLSGQVALRKTIGFKK